jgi:hypothetical protein
MKRCPTCNKTFNDQSLSYCIDDGTPLVSLPEDDELTEFGRGTEDGRWNPPAYQPPSYVAPGGATKRKSWPWIVGILGVLFLFLVGFTVAAVVLIPRIVKKANPVVVSNSNSNTNNSANNNTNSSTEIVPETNSNSESSSPPPTDREVVLAQLRDLENEWTVANINADKKKLGQILADDYVGPSGSNGKMQGKTEYINTIERDTNTEKWNFEDLRLTLGGDRATLLGKVRFQLRDREVVYDFVDRFVWRDARWQATGSEVTPTSGTSGFGPAPNQ